MKALVALLVSSFITLSGIAQTTTKVAIIFKGINKATNHYQVSIDETNYFSNTNTKNVPNYKINLENVPIGSHLLKVSKLKYKEPIHNNKNQTTLVYSKSFELRAGYNMNITILANGRVQFSEILSPVTANNTTTTKTPMTSTQFNTLVQNVKSKWSQSLKAEAIRSALLNTTNYFSSTQLRQLLALVTSESDRLDLARISYRSVTDPTNFNELVDLFNSTDKREEFNTFVSLNSGQTSTTAAKTQLTDYQFSQLVQSVKGQWSQSLKGEAIRDAVINTSNYFSTSQIRQLLTLITSESDRFDLVKLSYRGIIDTSNFASLVDLFNNSSYRNEFNNYVSGTLGQEVQKTTKVQMTEYQFTQLLQSVKGKWSQSLKGEAIKDAFVNTDNYFSTSQIRQLLMLITTESDRLELAKLSYRGVTDATNFSSLVDLFTQNSNKTEFNNYITTQGGTVATTTTTVNTPMSSADFDMLVLSIRGYFIQPLKTNAVITTFNNPNNYFTASQAKQLIALINAETSRLELSKLAYRSVTDRANFITQLNDLFQSQANRDNLAEYVRTYREQ